MAVEHDRGFGARLTGWGFQAYEGLFGAMPPEKASNAGAALIGALGPLISKPHGYALQNLAFAFPEKSEEEREAIAKAMWRGLGRTLAEFPHLKKLRADDVQGRIETVGAERLDKAATSGKGAVFISGHFANWEVMAAAIVQRGIPCHVTYRPANNGFVDDRIVARRQAYGVQLQAAKGRTGGMGLLRALAKGETVAIMNDQKNNEGVAAPFFGKPAMTSDGPTRLARRFDCPLIPLSVRRLGPARYRVTVHEEIEVDRGDDEKAAHLTTITRINAFMEARVREAPEDWFWVHRRWPKEEYR